MEEDEKFRLSASTTGSTMKVHSVLVEAAGTHARPNNLVFDLAVGAQKLTTSPVRKSNSWTWTDQFDLEQSAPEDVWAVEIRDASSSPKKGQINHARLWLCP